MVSDILDEELSQTRTDSRCRRFVCVIEDGNQRALPIQRCDRTPRTMLLFEREVPCPCEGTEHAPRKTEYSKSDKAFEAKRGSFSSGEYDMPSPPPQYRSRVSTLATLHEHASS